MRPIRSLAAAGALLTLASPALAADWRVFTTSSTHDGDFGGLAGADAYCDGQGEASFGSTTNWVAWLAAAGPDGRSAYDPLTDGRFVRPSDGVELAADLADLTDGSLNGPVALGEIVIPFTGTTATGEPDGNDCNGWTSSESDVFGAVGNPVFEGEWSYTTFGGGLPDGLPCSEPQVLYCFEIPPDPLDCAGLDPDICAAVNGLVPLVEAEVGFELLSATGPVRFRPMSVYTQLEALHQAITSGGCRVDGAFDGWTGGAYNAAPGVWSGAYGGPGGEAGAAQGTLRRVQRTFAGGYEGAETGLIGDGFSSFHTTGKLGGTREDGFIMGHWIRRQGNLGVFVGLHGVCDAGVDVAAAFEPWFPGTF